jgi:hypothetical protein
MSNGPTTPPPPGGQDRAWEQQTQPLSPTPGSRSQTAPPPGVHPPADQTHGGPPPPQPQPDQGRAWKTWQLVVAGVAGLLLGLVFGAAGGDATDDGSAPAATSDTSELEAEIERLQDEIAERDEALAAAADVADGQQPADEAETEPEAEPEPEPEPAEQGDVLTAGNYSFADVQVSEDFVNDFQVRTRMTNNGPARESVGITATIFSGGSVVATATGLASNVGEGATITLELMSTDDYRDDWDAIEFQVEYEF